MDGAKARRFRFQFGLRTLLTLIVGLSIGLVIVRVFDRRPPPVEQVLMHVRVFELPSTEMALLRTALQENGVHQVATARQSKTIEKLIAQKQRSGGWKVLVEPDIITTLGYSASFNVGGEIALPDVHDDGTITLDFHKYGTRFDATPNWLRNDRFQLELHLRVAKLDEEKPTVFDGERYPSIQVREMITTLELGDGDTAVICDSSDTNGADETQSPVGVLVLASLERIERLPVQLPQPGVDRPMYFPSGVDVPADSRR